MTKQEYDKWYRINNAAVIKAKRDANKHRYKAYQKAYREKNRDKNKEYQRNYKLITI